MTVATDSRRGNNIVLIGMPGSGKSTIGIVLAKRSGRSFVDTDVLIQVREQRTLQEILDTDGYRELRRVEELVLLGLYVRSHVIATGGSAVYSAPSMRHLRRGGIVVMLDTPLEQLRLRVRDYDTRGIAAAPGTDLEGLYRERVPLYRRYADVTIDCCDKDQDVVAAAILERIEGLST